MAVQRVLYGKLMKSELLFHLLEFGRRSVLQRHPHKPSWLAQVIADLAYRNVGHFGPVFIDDAVD